MNSGFVMDSIEAGSSIIATLTPTGSIKFYNKGNAAYPGALQGTINATGRTTQYLG